MKLVIIESPYSNKNEKTVEENTEYAMACMRNSLDRGEAPIASHLVYTQVLDDDNMRERHLGIRCGFAWNKKADLVAVYIDHGISKWMNIGIRFAKLNGIPIEYRTLPSSHYIIHERFIRRSGEVNRYCGLDYNNFFTLPRTVLQDMPIRWQEKFITLIEELDDLTQWREYLEEEDISLLVTAKRGKKFCALPEELYNYRRPIKKWVRE